MRLINVHSMKIEEHFGDGLSLPKYAILSHTWVKEEVSFQDYPLRAYNMRGYKKIQYACEQAKRDGLNYVWVDTCCIDKTSSVELSEAINSMFNWYRWAQICYAYLDDASDEYVEIISAKTNSAKDRSLNWCSWFKRGWTLQELLAPKNVLFYSHNWHYLGSKKSLAEEIALATSIPVLALRNREYISVYGIATKMSWAARRKTSRPEDMAYCLLGIFGVNMPLLYGEGKKKAFVRLQEELIKISDDESLFAWRNTNHVQPGILADSPLDFLDCGDVCVARFNYMGLNQTGNTPHSPSQFEKDAVRQQLWRKEPFSLTKLGLCIRLPLILKEDLQDNKLRRSAHGPDALGVLQCCKSSEVLGSHIALSLLETTTPGVYKRKQNGLITVSAEEVSVAQLRSIYIQGPDSASQYPIYWCEIDVFGPVFCTIFPIHNKSFTLWNSNRRRAEANVLLLEQTKVSMEFSCCISAAGLCFVLVLELDLITNQQTIILHSKPAQEKRDSWLEKYKEIPRDLYGGSHVKPGACIKERDLDTLCWWHEPANSILILNCCYVDPYQAFIRSKIVSRDSPYFEILLGKVDQLAFTGNEVFPVEALFQRQRLSCA